MENKKDLIKLAKTKLENLGENGLLVEGGNATFDPKTGMWTYKLRTANQIELGEAFKYEFDVKTGMWTYSFAKASDFRNATKTLSEQFKAEFDPKTGMWTMELDKADNLTKPTEVKDESIEKDKAENKKESGKVEGTVKNQYAGKLARKKKSVDVSEGAEAMAKDEVENKQTPNVEGATKDAYKGKLKRRQKQVDVAVQEETEELEEGLLKRKKQFNPASPEHMDKLIEKSKIVIDLVEIDLLIEKIDESVAALKDDSGLDTKTKNKYKTKLAAAGRSLLAKRKKHYKH